MPKSPRRFPSWLGLVALGAFGLLVGPGARADEGSSGKPASGTRVYDVRVVRVDATDSAVVETPPSWQAGGTAGATTTAPWADMLGALRRRGRATVLLDQRLTTTQGMPTDFSQEQRRSVLSLVNRTDKTDVWQSTYVETGASGQLASGSDGLRYSVKVSWEDRPSAEEMASFASASWKGSHPDPAAGETLVLSYRQQIAGDTASRGLEIYVLVTGWVVAGK
jgi:hypothetical protein